MSRYLICSGSQRCNTLTIARLMLSTMLFWVAEGSASFLDGIKFDPTEVDAIFRFERIDKHGGGDTSNDTRETEWEVGLRLRQTGHILDPGISSFLLDIEPIYEKNKFESSTYQEETSGDLLNYLLQLNLLDKTPGPLSFGLHAQRSSTDISGSLGSRYDNVIDSKRATVKWKTTAFPMSFIIEEKLLDQEFHSSQSNQLTERDEVLQTWAIRGNSSKLNLRLEHKTLDDRILSRDNDYDQDQAYLNHRLPWGRDSELISRFNFLEREGFNAYKRLTLDEIARIRHTDTTFSKTSYRFNETTQNIKTDQHYAKFELNHRLYKNLTTIGSVNIDKLNSENLDDQSKGIDIQTNYHKQGLFGASVNAGVGVGYEETDRESMAGFIDVIDESHVVPLSGQVTLKTRFILSSTIIVTNNDGTLVYEEGLDYEVNQLTGNLTELQIFSGGRIDPDDIILVSYQSSALPSQEFSTTLTRYNLALDWGWLRVSHLDRKSNDKLISGADESFLNDTRFMLTDIEFRWKINNNDLLLEAERSFTLAGNFESTTYTYRQLLSWINSKDLRWNLSATESYTTQLNRDTDLYSVDLSIDWRPAPALSVRPTVGYWKRYDTENTPLQEKREDEFLTAGFRLHWKYRKILIDFSYYHNKRSILSHQTGNETQTDEDRLMFNLTRRFL